MRYTWLNIFNLNINKSITRLLRTIPVFKGLKSRELLLISSVLFRRKYDEGEYIFHMQDPSSAMYVVNSGKVTITFETGLKKENTLILSRGDFFGEIALVDNSRRTASAIAAETSTLLVLTRPELERLVKTNSSLANKILLNLANILALRLRLTNERLFKIEKKLRQNAANIR